MVSGEEAPPVDRPNLSKDYLAGKASEEWVPLRPDSFYSENSIDLRLGTNATDIDVRAREVMLEGGTRVAYDRLLLATGAEPVRLSVSGAELPHVHTLRSLADCRAIIERLQWRDGPLCWVRASSGSKSRPLSVRATLRCMWWLRENVPWSASLDHRWAISCVRCMRSMAWSSTLGKQ
jgi:hypothetical protein